MTSAAIAKLPRPPLVEERLLAVVDGEWRTAREIYVLFGEGAFDGARNALVRLAHTGRVERCYSPLPTGQIARYRKSGAAAERG
jgi:hypothetical protein